MIPPETLDAIRDRVDLAELVREYVPRLRRAGRAWTAHCPFHRERTPSFHVNPERQTFHCYGCEARGDAFEFVMKMENLTFYEAVERLAERTGVKLAKRESELTPSDRERLRIREVLALAEGFYHDALLRSSEAAPAREYLKRRGVSAESVAAFKLGYAPRQSQSFLREAQRKGFDASVLVRGGIASSRDGAPPRDFFYGRVLYPIHDAKGQVTAFGGRALDDSHPKYLNSSESPVFSKSRTLFGLYQGLPVIRKSRCAVLVEGYMDVIACHQFGVVEALAPLGTALTPEHAVLLSRYASKVAVVFDADAAGLSAAVRGAETLLQAGLEVRVATVPEGKDPDELLQRSGVEPFKKCLAEAPDLVEFRTGLALKGRPAELDPATKSAIAREVMTTIAQCPDEVLKAEWVRRLAQRLRTDEEALLRQLHRGVPAGGGPGAAGAGARRTPARPHPDHGASSDQKAGTGVLPPADQQVLSLLMRQPGLVARVAETDWASAEAVRIWKVLAGLDTTAPSWPSKLLEALVPADRALASGLLVDSSPSADPEADLTSLLERRRGEKRLKELEPLVKADAPVDEGVAREYRDLLARLKGTRR
ncbi:MAG: DNA primase [Elusimicrobia bacterium]|nr:DNA primase [Elusimicrobiota bacterium]